MEIFLWFLFPRTARHPLRSLVLRDASLLKLQVLGMESTWRMELTMQTQHALPGIIECCPTMAYFKKHDCLQKPGALAQSR